MTTYVLPETDREARRLDAQGELFAGITERVLDAARIGPGMNCLDVGSGSGDVMRLLCHRVGDDGRVTGLDPNGLLGREATQAIDGSFATACTFVEGTIQEAPMPEAGPFDVITARWTLLHVPDPVSALQKLWSWLAPGGRLVVIDYDFRNFHAHPALSAVDELRSTIRGVLEGAGLDPYLGGKLPGLFLDAGIGHPDGVETEASVRDVGEVSDLLRATFESFLPAALKLGVMTSERAEVAMAELERSTSAGSYFVLRLVVGCWKGR